MNRDSHTVAASNLAALQQNPYPGRGIVMGMDQTGRYLVQIYWLMGRSPNSRNRIFVHHPNGALETEFADQSQAQDASLTIYTAMAEKNLKFVVSNGHQTIPVLDGKPGCGLNKLLLPWTYEPDAPNFTNRITAVFDLNYEYEFNENEFTAEIGVLTKSSLDEQCSRSIFKMPIHMPGFGYCVTTYSGDGNPLPPFEDAPYLLPLIGDIKEIAGTMWGALNLDNRVSLAVKFIDTTTGKSEITVINKYEQVLSGV
jgi:hypothetical protein